MGVTIVLQSDHSPYSLYFAKATGLIQRNAPGTDVDQWVCGLDPDDIMRASSTLYMSLPYWPEGTLFVSQVGETKGQPAALVLKNRSIVFCPNNGLATMVLDAVGLDHAVALGNEELDPSDPWIYVKAAAKAAAGVPVENLGSGLKDEEVYRYFIPDALIEEGKACGEVSMLLRSFGNITFNIKTDDFEKTGIRNGDAIRVVFTRDGKTVYDEKMTYQPSFGYVPKGDPVVFNGSSGYIDIGLNMDSFIDRCLPDLTKAENIGDYKVTIMKIEEDQK